VSATTVLASTHDSTVETDQPVLRGCRVLLVEDGPDNQRLISYVLEKAGAEVTVVESGERAITAILAARSTETPFHVVLMDMQMPVMDGYTATRRLRREGYTGPIVALTAHAMTSDRERCLACGCDEYISKPINRCLLIETIRGFFEAGSDGRSSPHLSATACAKRT
jgi:CheY-like chemotaxis protein